MKKATQKVKKIGVFLVRIYFLGWEAGRAPFIDLMFFVKIEFKPISTNCDMPDFLELICKESHFQKN